MWVGYEPGSAAQSIQGNVGVEMGQVIALTAVLLVLSYWRTRDGFLQRAFITNGVLMACGFLLVGINCPAISWGHDGH